MGTTIERNGGMLKPQAPAHEALSPEQQVALHEMPDLSTHAPDVDYGQPRRSWLRYLAVGAAVGAVAVGAGLVASTVGTDDGTPTFGNEYSLAREHLAQTPGGFPFIQPNGTTWVSMERSLEMEHIAQTPGGFPG